MIEVDRSAPAKSAQPWDSDDVETLRWQVGDATVFRIGELDATAALAGPHS